MNFAASCLNAKTLCHELPKMKAVISLVLFLISSGAGNVYPDSYPRVTMKASDNSSAGEPLMLTPFLKNGSASQAQRLSRVSITDELGFVSHAGFFTVDEKYNSNMYFWYFPPICGDNSAPVLLWVEGGPGASGLYGLFSGVGPLKTTKRGFAKRKHNWAEKYHVIFVDSPVGSGYSFTDSDDGYCTDEDCVAKGLYSFMRQFYQMFPDLKDNDFYLTGESYAGKYIPSFGMEIHQRNLDEREEYKINFKGMVMGNAYCDPITQTVYGIYLYQHGLIDYNQLQMFEALQNEVIEAIRREDWVVANARAEKFFGNGSYFQEFTGFENTFNYLETKERDYFTRLLELLNLNENRRSVHIGNLQLSNGLKAIEKLAGDILLTVAPKVAELLNYYPTMFFSGQLDVQVSYPGTENFLRHLDFSSAEEYKTAPRHIWRVDGDIAGYYKTAGNLTEALVRNAGHTASQDKPKWVLDLINKFIDGDLK